jgi:type VI secretion system protein ImpM
VNDPASGAPGEPAGWFGKLACVGDFASRRLPPEFTQACDAWLSRCLEASRSALGERWLDTYLTSPVYRFAWAPGVVDKRWWFGAMMPSVDNVGRYFPLLVAQGCAEPPSAAADLDRLERWYARAIEAALVTLEPGATLERFEALLAAAPAFPLPAEAALAVEAQWPDHTSHTLSADSALSQGLASFAAQETLRRFRACSMWWPLPAEGEESRLSVAVGLPAAESFAQLLEGAW